MADRNFDSLIQTIISDLNTLIPTASVDDLVKLTRIIKNIKQTENASLETLINTRLNTLLQNATGIDEVAKLSTAVNRVLDLVTPETSSGRELPRQDGYVDSFLKTDGTNMSWSTIAFSDINDIDHNTLSINDVLQYNTSTAKYTGVSKGAIDTTVLISNYTDFASFPTGNNGQFGIADDTNTIYYHNGTEWIEFGSI